MNQTHRAAPVLSDEWIMICAVAAVLLALPVTAQQVPATPAVGAAISQSHVTFPACAAVIDVTKLRNCRTVCWCTLLRRGSIRPRRLT